MASTFPRTRNSRQGYDVDEVEDFLEDARTAYSNQRPDVATVTAQSIRRTAFSMQKGGYSPSHVDAALERLEDAFATRERERAFAQVGDQAWYGRARATAQVVLDRLDRPDGQKFNRTGILTHGYNAKEVDAFAERLVNYFQHGKPMSVDEVRTVVFRSTKRGYAEWQVDLLLDSVTNVMLAVR
ncbi:MAG: DivIVA domain-containing protein [Rhodoglobus sp.]